MKRAAELGALALEVSRVLVALPRIEWGRRFQGPKPLVKALRGYPRPSRNGAARERLRRAIGWVDRHCPGGPNCYRRVLLEVALDSRAGAQPLCLGFYGGGGTLSGHAWLGENPVAAAQYRFTIRL